VLRHLWVHGLTSGKDWLDVDRLAIKKVRRYVYVRIFFLLVISPQVMHDGSNIRNEFKTMARQLVMANTYNMFSPHTEYQNPEHIKQRVACKVGALLNKSTGEWMHSKDSEVSNILATVAALLLFIGYHKIF
jgi:hypothetical protein